MSDSSPILLIIDAQTAKFGPGNGHLVPALNYAQTLYPTVVLARRRDLGRLAVSAASHAKVRARAYWSAIGTLDGFKLGDRVVHVCMPDIDHSLIATVGDLDIRGVNFLVLSDLCGSSSGRVSAGGELIYLGRFVGSSRLARAANVAPTGPVVPVVTPPVVAEIRPKLRRQLLSADGTLDDLQRIYGILMFSEGSIEVGVDAFGALLRLDASASEPVSVTPRPSRRAPLIDSYTSASAYRMAAGPAPDGSSIWTAELVAHELQVRCMVASISAARVEQHFEANERLGVSNPLRVVDGGSSSAAPGLEAEAEAGGEVVSKVIPPEEMVSSVLELASTAGLGQVAESMGVSEDDLELMLAGEAEWSQRAFQVVGEVGDFLSLSNVELPPSGLPLVYHDEELERFKATPQVPHRVLPEFREMSGVFQTSGYDSVLENKEALAVEDVSCVQTQDGDILRRSQDLNHGVADVGWVSLSVFDGEHKPGALRFPDGEERKVLYWVDMFYVCAEWLVRKGMISDSSCPVSLSDSREPVLFFGQLPDAYLESRRYRELPGGFYLRSKFTSALAMKNCKLLLQRFGADLSSFHVYVG